MSHTAVVETLAHDNLTATFGVGHCSVYEMNGKWYFIAHAYDKNVNGASKLYIREIEWKDGWPLITDRNPAK